MKKNRLLTDVLQRGSAKGAASPAFTILELLVVLSLIAIVIGFVLPSFMPMRDKAKEQKAMVTCKHLELAFNEYYNINRKWPAADSGPREVKGTLLGKLVGQGVDQVTFFEIGTNTVDNFKDPWGENYYMVAFDANFDNQVDHAEHQLNGVGTVQKSVLVWNLHTYTRHGNTTTITNKSW